MHTQNKPACDRDCFHCPYPDCILDEDDMSPEEWHESQEREKSIRQEGRSKAAADRAAYYQANKEKVAAYQAAYRQANKDEINARRREKRKKAAAVQQPDGPRITTEEAS